MRLKPNDLIEEFWKNNKSEINDVIKGTYYQNYASMMYLGIERDEYESLANKIIVEQYNSFRESVTSNPSNRDPVILLKTIVDRKIKSYIKGQNRDKRKANYESLSIHAATWEDGLVDEVITTEESDGVNICEYLKKLSERQKNILILKLLGLSDGNIIKTMNLSRKAYNGELNSMQMSEKIKYIKEITA